MNGMLMFKNFQQVGQFSKTDYFGAQITAEEVHAMSLENLEK
jgi:hypothetical protein